MKQQMSVQADDQVNPRYQAYARAQGRTPAQQLEHDRLRWPGGCMCGFILWIAGWWHHYMAVRRRPLNDVRWNSDHAAFDLMLAEACAVEADQSI